MEKDNEVVTSCSKNEELNGVQQIILDLFRIIAAFFVLFGHSFSFYKCTIFKDQTYFMYLQNIGVVIFFLLSGFLMALSLEKCNKGHQYTFMLFVIHKIFRIWKEYLPGLVIIAIIDAISISINAERYPYFHAYNIKQFIGNTLMLHNMGPEQFLGKFFVPFGSGRPLWTLSVEWWLYMLFGAVFLSLRNKEKVLLPKMLLFGLIVFMCSSYLITARGGGLGFVFALGMLGYYGYRIVNYKTAIIVFVFSCMLYITYGVHSKEAYTVYSFIILWFIFSSALKIGGGITLNLKRNSVLSFISKSTFMLYLLHYSIIDLLYRVDVSWNVPVKFALGIILSLLLSCLSYYAFGEKNAVGLIINKIFNRR